MTAQKNIRTNYILNTLYQVLTLLTPLITTPYMSRVFGADGVGIYSYVSSILGFFTMFSSLGTAIYGQREIAQNRDKRKEMSQNFWEIELLSVLTTGICIAVWIIHVFVSGSNQIYFAVLTLELIAVAFDISWFYAGIENFAYIVLRNTFVKFAGIAALFIFVKSSNDMVIYIGIIAVSRLAGNISMWYKIDKLIDSPDIKNIRIKKHFNETVIYFIPTIASSVYTYLDKVMIGAITHDNAENGYYFQSGKIIQIAYTIIVSLNTVMASRISYLFAQNNMSEIKNKLEKALAYILTISIPIAFGISGVADKFVPWFFGDNFDKVVILLIICSPLVILQSVHNYFSAQYLIPSGQRVRSTKAVIAGAFINFVCNAVLIPHFKSIGAIIGTLIGETVICLIYFYMSKEVVSYKWFLRYLPKQLAASCFMYIVLRIVAMLGFNGIVATALQISAGVFVYGFSLILLREKFTMNIVKELIEKVSRIICRTN